MPTNLEERERYEERLAERAPDVTKEAAQAHQRGSTGSAANGVGPIKENRLKTAQAICWGLSHTRRKE